MGKPGRTWASTCGYLPGPGRQGCLGPVGVWVAGPDGPGSEFWCATQRLGGPGRAWGSARLQACGPGVSVVTTIIVVVSSTGYCCGLQPGSLALTRFPIRGVIVMSVLGSPGREQLSAHLLGGWSGRWGRRCLALPGQPHPALGTPLTTQVQ